MCMGFTTIPMLLPGRCISIPILYISKNGHTYSRRTMWQNRLPKGLPSKKRMTCTFTTWWWPSKQTVKGPMMWIMMASYEIGFVLSSIEQGFCPKIVQWHYKLGYYAQVRDRLPSELVVDIWRVAPPSAIIHFRPQGGRYYKCCKRAD